MTPREYCKHNPPAAVYSDGMTGVTVHGIEHGINDYIYARSGIPRQYRYHWRRVYHTRGGRLYFILDGRRVHLDECIRI